MTTALHAGTRVPLVLLLVALGLSALTGAARAQSPADAEVDATVGAEEELLALTNGARAAEGHAPLQIEPQLVEVARGWSTAMASDDALSHNPNLTGQVAGDWTLLGENVGWTVKSGATPSELVERLHTAFMESPSHRANIMSDFNLAGVGVSVTPEGKMWVTVVFAQATPAPVPEESAPAAPEPAAADAGTPIEAAAAVSRELIDADAADYVVLARDDVFADALGGSGLVSARAPVLFTEGPTDANASPSVNATTMREIDRALQPAGTVYLLGGPAAVAGSTEAELRAAGYDVRRLAGDDRIATAHVVAEEVVRRRGEPEQVLVARADDWADAISGGAYAASTGAPLILSGSDDLAPEAAGFLADHPDAEVVALGGPAALADEVVADAGARRVAGVDRAQTAVAVAEELWGYTGDHATLSVVTAPGYTDSGWAYALGYTVLSVSQSSPQLLVGETVPESVRRFVERMGEVEVTAAGPVPEPVVAELSSAG